MSLGKLIFQIKIYFRSRYPKVTFLLQIKSYFRSGYHIVTLVNFPPTYLLNSFYKFSFLKLFFFRDLVWGKEGAVAAAAAAASKASPAFTGVTVVLPSRLGEGVLPEGEPSSLVLFPPACWLGVRAVLPGVAPGDLTPRLVS